jgi:hypothetical protein
VVVPSFYLIMDDISYWLAKFFRLFIGTKEVEPEAPEATELAQRINRVGTENAALRDRLSQIEAKIAPRIKPATQHAAE